MSFESVPGPDKIAPTDVDQPLQQGIAVGKPHIDEEPLEEVSQPMDLTDIKMALEAVPQVHKKKRKQAIKKEKHSGVNTIQNGNDIAWHRDDYGTLCTSSLFSESFPGCLYFLQMSVNVM